MQEIPILKFKVKCLASLEQVRATGEPIRISRYGKPVAGVVPPTVVMDRDACIGSLKPSCKILGDIVSPANDEDEWEVLRDSADCKLGDHY